MFWEDALFLGLLLSVWAWCVRRGWPAGVNSVSFLLLRADSRNILEGCSLPSLPGLSPLNVSQTLTIPDSWHAPLAILLLDFA